MYTEGYRIYELGLQGVHRRKNVVKLEISHFFKQIKYEFFLDLVKKFIKSIICNRTGYLLILFFHASSAQS